jgi:hypothetical protein
MGMAADYNNLAAVLSSQGSPAAAETLYRKALEIVRKVQGEDSPTTAGSYNNLATSLADQRK